MTGFGFGACRSSKRRPRTVAAPADPLAFLKAHSAVLAVYDPSDLSTMWQNIDGPANASPTPALAGQPVGYVKNLRAGATGYNLAATDTGFRPLATNGLTFDGADDRLEYTFPGSAGPTMGALVSLFKTSETNGAYLFTGTATTSRVFIAATTGLLSATGTPYINATLELDGSTVASGAAAVNDGVAHTLVATVGLSGVTGLRIGGGTAASACLAGAMIPPVLLNADDADFAAALTQAKAWMAALKTALAL